MAFFLGRNELAIIFSNIEDLLLQNSVFLSDLENTQQIQDYFIDSIADLFLKHVMIYIGSCVFLLCIVYLFYTFHYFLD